MKTALPFLLAFALVPLVRAEVRPSRLFADHVVLQQKMEVPVWGTASEGEKVTVDFAGQHVSTTAKDGKWTVRLQPLAASATPQTLTIAGEKNTVSIQDVLVGEVWLCSGQSNMERHLGPQGGQQPIDNAAQEIAAANYPLIRQFTVARKLATAPQTDLNGQWLVCSPETVPQFTAVGYFFGRDIFKVVDVPIGLIHSSWGGTPAEAWTRHEALEANPELHLYLDIYQKAVANYPGWLAKYKADEPALMQKYEADAKAAADAGKPAPRKPQPPINPVGYSGQPSVLYNGMIVPLEPFALRGVIWYQGESNTALGKQYYPLFSTMIADWRKVWGEGEFPFLFVQVAPFKGTGPEVRESQLLTFKHTPNTAMAVITDKGDAADIHPPHKQAVGMRLALAAEALAYGRKIEYSGPVYQAMKVEGNRAELSFSHVGSGLEAKDGELKGFAIAGADKKFVPAKAEIQGGQVVVSSEQVPTPAAVRYGWANVPDVNLLNKEGLPASPFATDEER